MYNLMPAKDENLLFFRLDGDAAKQYGAIGYFRADFGIRGNKYRSLWFDNQRYLKTQHFVNEFNDIISFLRSNEYEAPFANRKSLEEFCERNPGKKLSARGNGYFIRTNDYTYYFRCHPHSNGIEIHGYAYDNRYLLSEL